MIDVKKIAITGAPSSGKTTIIGMLGQLLEGTVLVVPEVPTLFFNSGLGVSEWDRIVSDAGMDTLMMKGIVSLRCNLEASFRDIAVLSRAKALLIDRGGPDAASYLENPVPEYSAFFSRDLAADVHSYYAVIQLGAMANSYVGRQKKFGGKATDPPGARIAQLEGRLKQVWGRHPRYHFVDAEFDLGRKLTTVMAIVSSFLSD